MNGNGDAETPACNSPASCDDVERLIELMRGKCCLLLDFDGPVCGVFAGYPAPEVAAWMRSALQADGLPLTDLGMTTTDPMMVLSDAAASSPAGQVRGEQLLQEAEAECVQTSRPTPGAHDLIRTSHERGMKVVIVSNNGAKAIRTYLDLHGLKDFVLDVIGRDPDDASLMKPHPHLMHRALAASGCQPRETVFVGDSITDVAAGLATDVPVIGFANKPHKFQTLATAGADVLVTDMRRISGSLATL